MHKHASDKRTLFAHSCTFEWSGTIIGPYLMRSVTSLIRHNFLVPMSQSRSYKATTRIQQRSKPYQTSLSMLWDYRYDANAVSWL